MDAGKSDGVTTPHARIWVTCVVGALAVSVALNLAVDGTVSMAAVVTAILVGTCAVAGATARRDERFEPRPNVQLVMAIGLGILLAAAVVALIT